MGGERGMEGGGGRRGGLYLLQTPLNCREEDGDGEEGRGGWVGVQEEGGDGAV